MSNKLYSKEINIESTHILLQSDVKEETNTIEIISNLLIKFIRIE